MPEPISADAEVLVHRWVDGDEVPEAPVSRAFALEILAAEALGHDRLQMAWIVERAVELRTTGLLVRWQSEFAAYPEPLREKLIEANTRVWQLSHANGPGVGPTAAVTSPWR